MKKIKLFQILSLIFVCAMLLCAFTIAIVAAEDKTVEIASFNAYYGEKYQLMYAIKAPDGAEISAVDSQGKKVHRRTGSSDPRG